MSDAICVVFLICLVARGFYHFWKITQITRRESIYEEASRIMNNPDQLLTPNPTEEM